MMIQLYEFKRTVGKHIFSAEFRKIIQRYKKCITGRGSRTKQTTRNIISELYFIELCISGLQTLHLDKSVNIITNEIYILRPNWSCDIVNLPEV